MARTTALIICVVLATLFHGNAALTNTQVIQQDITKIMETAKVITGDTKQEITSVLSVVTSIVKIDPIVALIDGLREDLLSLVGKVAGDLGETVEKALTTVLSSVRAIGDTLSGIVPSLNGIVKALAGILDQVLALVNSLLQAVLDLLGGLIGDLKGVVGGLLTQLTSLGQVLLGNVADVLEKHLGYINGALTTIQDFVLNKLIPALPSLDQVVTTLAASVLGRLFSLPTLVSGLIQKVLDIVFVLLAQLDSALQGLLTPVLSTLTSVLGVVGNCASCLTSGGLLGGLLGRRRRYIA